MAARSLAPRRHLSEPFGLERRTYSDSLTGEKNCRSVAGGEAALAVAAGELVRFGSGSAAVRKRQSAAVGVLQVLPLPGLVAEAESAGRGRRPGGGGVLQDGAADQLVAAAHADHCACVLRCVLTCSRWNTWSDRWDPLQGPLQDLLCHLRLPSSFKGDDLSSTWSQTAAQTGTVSQFTAAAWTIGEPGQHVENIRFKGFFRIADPRPSKN